MTTVIYLENALTPHLRRVEQGHGSIRSLAPDWQVPFVAFVDGRPVLRADWELVLDDDQALAFIEVNAIPQGGGGGGGSDSMRMVLMLAVLVMAPQIGAFMGPGAMGLGGAGVFGMSAATWTGVAMFSGMMLVNAIIPPPKPPSTQQAAALAAPSPTYNLQAQGNAARLDGAIPEHFGRMVAFPDYAAQPYSEFSGNEQFLYQLLCIGRGQYSIESIRIEDTPITSFDEIEYEVIAPGGALSLFPANVISSVEVSGQSLYCKAATYSQSGTTVTVTMAAHGLSAGKSVYLDFTSGTAVDGTFTVVSAPTADTFTYTAAGSLTTSGNVTASPWVGGFIASASGTTANFIGMDFVMPRGLYWAELDGSLTNIGVVVTTEARTVDAVGTPTSAWATLGTATYVAATTTPQRQSERYSVTVGRYEVRVRRTDIENTDTRAGHSIAWSSMRAYLPDARTFGDVTLLAMRMRASNNLSMQASRKINVICTRMIPVWNGSTWSANTATRSPAWAIAYACKQVGMADAQIDLAGLLTLAGTCTARSDYFDARFDNFLTFWEAVTKMAGAVRAKPFMQGGILRIMRDQAVSIPVALFSVRNMVRGSFSINYLMPTADTADAVDVKYFDSNSWAQATVRAKLPGSSALVPAKVDLFGVTSRDQAFREGMYQAASNRYRRKIITFKTEMEGFIPSFGDLIAIQHDMPAWGQGGEFVPDSGILNVNKLTYSEQLDNGAWLAGFYLNHIRPTVTANTQVAPDGVTTADTLTSTHATASSIGSSYVSAAPSTTYTASVWLKAGTCPDARFGFATGLSGTLVGTPISTISLTASWQRFTATYTVPPSGVNQLQLCITVGNQAGSGPVGTTIHAWGAQVEVGSIATTYNRTPVTGLATTNLLTYSEQFDNATWNSTLGVSRTPNTTAAPDATVTADTITETAVNSQHYVYTALSLAAGSTYTFSVYAKSANRNIALQKNNGGQNIDKGFNLTSGTAYASGSGYFDSTTYSIVPVGGGWYRCSLTFTNVTAGSCGIGFLMESGTAASYLGDGTSSVQLWGAQLEVGGSATPYIRTTSAAATGYVYTLSEPLTWSAGSNHYIGLRKRDGSVDGPYLVTSTYPLNKVVFSSPPALTPYTDGNEERTHYAFGPAETWRQPARVLSAKPQSLTTVEITAVNEESNVHTAESGITTPVQVTSQLAGYTNAPDVLGLVCRSMPNAPEQMLLTWQSSPWADYYLVEQSADGLHWTRTGEPSSSNYTAIALYGNATVIRVAAVGIARGPWRQVNYGSAADYMWNSVDTTLMWNAITTTPMWRY